ncbi:MAG: metallophosphoesterase [Clostridia bacterium]|nr:metallophosphoesterase [Clostridia bacterium]
MSKKVKFGVFADLHVDIIHDAKERLEKFLDVCRKEDVDFIIQLGDFCYRDENRKVVCQPDKMPPNIKLALQKTTKADKHAIVNLYNNFEKPSYHILGNHECDVCSKSETLEFLGMKDGSWYSFDMCGYHFIALDNSYYMKDGKYIAYSNGNYFDESYHRPRVLPYMPPEELEWLREDLAKAEYPSILFSHQGLAADNVWSVLNNEDVREVLRNAPNGVLASFNGHEHWDFQVNQDGIWYINLNSMSCLWMDMGFVVENVYGEEIDKDYPNIKYTAPYEDANFAIVTITDEGIDIKGTPNKYHGPTPAERGFYEEKSWYHNIKNADRPEHTPDIADRFLPFKK